MVDSTARALALAARTYADGKISQSLDGLSFKALTDTEYKAIIPDSSTVYYVTDDSGKVTQYLGTAELSKGTGATTAVLAADGSVIGVVAEATEIEEV